jgi:uncharacterized protein YdhG (YjbR/CyaY superfamily)
MLREGDAAPDFSVNDAQGNLVHRAVQRRHAHFEMHSAGMRRMESNSSVFPWIQRSLTENLLQSIACHSPY